MFYLFDKKLTSQMNINASTCSLVYINTHTINVIAWHCFESNTNGLFFHWQTITVLTVYTVLCPKINVYIRLQKKHKRSPLKLTLIHYRNV